MNHDRHTFVFVGGLHRSGTSLLTQALAQHPAISAFHDTGVPEHEGQHLQDVYLPAYRHGGPGRFALDPRAHLDERSPEATPDHASRLFRQWSRHWQLEREFLLEKSPPNLIRGRFLQALFPSSRFVFVLRHPVAVTLATERHWPGPTLPSLLKHWLAAHRQLAADRPLLKHHLLVRYENLVRDSQAALDSLTVWLGLPPHVFSQSVAAGLNAAYFESWRKRRRQGASGLALRVWELLYEPSVRRWGYSFWRPF